MAAAYRHRRTTAHREKLVILGGHIGLPDEKVSSSMREWVIDGSYPEGLARRILRATWNRLVVNLPPTQSRAGGRSVLPSEYQTVEARNFPPLLMRHVYGDGMLSAVLSGISHRAMSRYPGARHHCEYFTRARNASPWITRSSPDWDDAPIGFILFEARILGNAEKAIRFKIASPRFRHLLVGMPDFTEGGGAIHRYCEALSVRVG